MAPSSVTSHPSLQVFTESAEYSVIGPSHNIVGNADTGYVYIVGARGWDWNLATPVIGDKIDNKYKETACEGMYLEREERSNVGLYIVNFWMGYRS